MAGPDVLISADSHVVPLPTFWRDYLPARFRDRAPVVEQTDAGEVSVFEGRRSPVMAINSIAGKSREGQGFAYRRFADQVAGGHDPAARLADQDRDGVVAEVLYGGGPLPTWDTELFVASHYAYNDWLADFCRYDARRLLGVAYIPFASPEIATAEIRRARTLGLRGTLIPATPPSGHWWDDEWAPVWRALVETGLPAGLHVGFGFARKHRFAGGPAFMTDVMMTKMEMAGPLADLVFGGVLQRHPELRVISVEAYIGWLPFVAEYVDHVYEVHRYWNDLGLAGAPSVYPGARSPRPSSTIRSGSASAMRSASTTTCGRATHPHGRARSPSRAHVERTFAGPRTRREIVYEPGVSSGSERAPPPDVERGGASASARVRRGDSRRVARAIEVGPPSRSTCRDAFAGAAHRALAVELRAFLRTSAGAVTLPCTRPVARS
jgi:predicted TIM-barrel fold metal-dependent hydrolase